MVALAPIGMALWGSVNVAQYLLGSPFVGAGVGLATGRFSDAFACLILPTASLFQGSEVNEESLLGQWTSNAPIRR